MLLRIQAKLALIGKGDVLDDDKRKSRLVSTSALFLTIGTPATVKTLPADNACVDNGALSPNA